MRDAGRGRRRGVIAGRSMTGPGGGVSASAIPDIVPMRAITGMRSKSALLSRLIECFRAIGLFRWK